MSGPRFFALAERVIAYGGALAVSLAPKLGPGHLPPAPGPQADEWVDSSSVVLHTHPVLADLFD